MTSRRPNGNNIGRAFEAVFLLQKKPRTLTELITVMGCTRDVGRRYIRLAVAEGLIDDLGTRNIGKPGPWPRFYGVKS